MNQSFFSSRIQKGIQKIHQAGNLAAQVHLSAFGAQAAFFLLLSLFPLALFLSFGLSFFPWADAFLELSLLSLLPRGLGNDLLSLFIEAKQSLPTHAALGIALISSLWSSSKIYLAISHCLSALLGDSSLLNYWKRRLLGCLQLLLLLPLTALFGALVVFGNKLHALLGKCSPFFRTNGGGWFCFRILLSALLLFFFALLTYFFSSSGAYHKLKKLLPGAVFFSLSFSGFSWLFSFYVDHFWQEGLYGSLTSLALAMLWIYFLVLFLLGGALLLRLFSSS